MKEQTIFPREEHADVLFQKILADPWACDKLFETFCNDLFSNDELEDSLSADEFCQALFRAYRNRDLSAFLMAISKNTLFDLIRNSYLIPYRFNADGKTNPVIMTDENGLLLPEFKNCIHEKEYQHFREVYNHFDGKKKMYEMLADFKPVHVVELPNCQTEDGIQLYKKELLRFKKVLEDKFETTITDEAVLHQIKLRNGINKALRRLQYVMANDPAPVNGLDVINTVYGSSFDINTEGLEDRINAVTDKIEKEYKEGKNIGKKPRILVTGSPSGGAALKVIRAIEDNGGVVVCFENCTGMKPLAMVDEENPDVYDALARKYLNIGCSCMSPNKNRMDLLDELIDDFHVDGVVDLVLQACHTYNVETAIVKKLVKDKKGIPYTVVETDYSQADIEQINTRMAAFIEML